MNIHDDLDPTLFSPDQDAMVRRELEPGEKLVWLGRPIARRIAVGWWPIAIFGLVFSGMGALVVGMLATMAAEMDDSTIIRLMAVLIGVTFVLGGLVITGLPFLVYRRATRTVYALTNRRAIIWDAGLGSNIHVRTFDADRLGSTSRRERSDGTGDLIFEETVAPVKGDPRHVIRFGFFAINHVHEVQNLLRAHVLKGG